MGYIPLTKIRLNGGINVRLGSEVWADPLLWSYLTGRQVPVVVGVRGGGSYLTGRQVPVVVGGEGGGTRTKCISHNLQNLWEIFY